MTMGAEELMKESGVLLEALETHITNAYIANFALVAHQLKGASLEVSGYQFCHLIN